MPTTRTYAAIAATFLLAGCSETSFMDTLGIGKQAPDERLVSTNPPLSVPPDMQLRPPADAAPVPQQAAAAANNGNLSGPQSLDAVPTPGESQPLTVNGKPVSKADEIYVKHGINPYKPDGTHKTVVELNRELAAKIREEKKRKNPKYGTIFNIGDLFK